MPQFLRIEVMDLEWAVMDMSCGIGAYEEAMVIDVIYPTIDMGK